MEQTEAWWTEQTYMFGMTGRPSLYDLETAAKNTVIYGRRVEYYERKVAEELVAKLDWRTIRRIVNIADKVLDDSEINGAFKTEYQYYNAVKDRLTAGVVRR